MLVKIGCRVHRIVLQDVTREQFCGLCPVVHCNQSKRGSLVFGVGAVPKLLLLVLLLIGSQSRDDLAHLIEIPPISLAKQLHPTLEEPIQYRCVPLRIGNARCLQATLMRNVPPSKIGPSVSAVS